MREIEKWPGDGYVFLALRFKKQIISFFKSGFGEFFIEQNILLLKISFYPKKKKIK